jgi:hypothetical protein
MRGRKRQIRRREKREGGEEEEREGKGERKKTCMSMKGHKYIIMKNTSERELLSKIVVHTAKILLLV